MRIGKHDLDWAVSQDLLSADQAANLWQALEARDADRPKFDLTNVIYYFGALIVIGAMGWFMNEAWEQFGGPALFGLATGYAAAFLLIGRTFWNRPGYLIPGGLFVTMAVCMVPLAIYGLQRWTGFWQQGDPGAYRDFHIWIKGSWFWMEVGTIAAGLAALRFFRFPFLTAPVAFALWYMSMDVAALVFGTDHLSFDDRKLVSLWLGLAVLVVSFLADRRTRQDFSFWGYLFGMLAFWGGLSLMKSDSELSKFCYCLINVGLMLLSVLLQRRVFLVFGSLGVCGYLGYLADKVFKDSLLFPFALSLLGLGVIALGILYQRHRRVIEHFILAHVPAGVLKSLPGQRAG